MGSSIKTEVITKTLIVVVLDESGSMGIQKNDVIGGYNSFLQQQLDISTDQVIILFQFNSIENKNKFSYTLCIPEIYFR